MGFRLSLRFCTFSSFVCTLITLIFLSQAELLDKRIFSIFHRDSDSGSATCNGQKSNVSCPMSELPSQFAAYRRFLMFQCVLVLIGLLAFTIVRERQNLLDKKLTQKVNRQIAAGV
ncbi:unnamed protein product [Dicrocoelium dendriticum]|nr:unnamed protein product [Dicrocoelium dendriticum]